MKSIYALKNIIYQDIRDRRTWMVEGSYFENSIFYTDIFK